LRLLAVVLLSTLLLASGCKEKRKWTAPEPISAHPFLASAISVTERDSSAQFLLGFYPVEGAWSWTKKDFSVALGPPPTAPQKGATLALKFALPDLIMQKLKSLTLSASVNGFTLAPEHYTKAGEYTYSRDVPPSGFTSEKITVDFHLDKALPADSSTGRELGIVVSAVGFENK
jgi:hypothetical protein